MIRFTKAKPPPKKPKKQPGGKKATLNKLKSFLTAAEPETVEILVSNWNAQQNSVTYKELREAYLAGGLTEKQFQKWQKDYSKLVTSTLAPKWQAAADAAAQEVKAQYPYFVYEPSVSASMDFIKQHGAELVTNLAQEQRDALNAVIAHCSGYTAVTPDEAARMIRPCIGLTKPQALANARYYDTVKAAYIKAHPKGKPETAEKKAQEASARYAARQHRYRAQSIARTELAYAYNAGAYGATKDAQAQGYIGDCMKVWLTAYDERVCPICSKMDEEKRNMDEPFSNGKMLPPGHPQCRCAVAYEEIEGTNLNPAPQAGTMDVQGQPQQQPQTQPPAAAQPVQPTDPNQPTIPPDIPIPNGMTYKGPANLGGTGKMYIYEDADGQEWLFKPAQSKSGKPEIFRAYSQEAGYKVQSIVDPDSAVPVGTGTLDGKFGAFQQRINTTSGTDFKQWQYNGGQLPAGTAEQLQRESVTDWLLGNYDSHGGNFVTDSSGRIIGIDKEQAFKYLKDPASHKLSYTYHPNSKYGETEPIHNTLYRRYANGEIDLDLQDTLKYIKRVEAIPDAEYREIFRSYAEGVCGKGQAAEQLLDSILERKQNLRQTFADFYTELEADRNGTASPFKWADELAGTATTASPKTTPLPKPKTTKPKTTKPAAPKTPPAATTPAPTAPVKTESGYRMSEVMDDLSVLPKNQHGVAVRSDGGMVENLNLTGRRVTIDGTDYYEFSGKLTEESWKQAAQNAKKRGYSQQMEFLSRDAQGGYSRKDVGMKLDAYKIMTLDQGEMEIYSDIGNQEQFGLAGYFRVRIPATGNAAADKKVMQTVFDKTGLSALTADPTDAEELLLRKTRLAWQQDPKAFEKARYLTGSAREKAIDDILAKAGIDDKRIQGMQLKEVFPGYSTYVDDSASMLYRKAGATHVWAGVDSPDAVVAICQSDGFAATNYRITSGMKKCGASPGADMKSGGSDGVFTRLGTKTDMSYAMSFLGDDYRVIISPDVLNRTDWYAHRGDSFGAARTTDARWQKRLGSMDFIKSETGSKYSNNSFTSDNEILFRHGISTDTFVGISCQDERRRKALLDKFSAAGITEFNGVPIEDFVTVTTKVEEDSMRGILGLDFYNQNPF